MLLDSDHDRIDAIMAKVLQRRENRGFNVPDRDEELIAEILNKAEKAAAEEQASLVEFRTQFAAPVKFQPTVRDSNEGKEFPQMDRYRNFTSDE